jgi:hypothetical protein
VNNVFYTYLRGYFLFNSPLESFKISVFIDILKNYLCNYSLRVYFCSLIKKFNLKI